MTFNKLGQVTLLPAQIRRLAEIARETTGALSVHQEGSVLTIFDGQNRNVRIDANGRTLDPPNQEPLC